VKERGGSVSSLEVYQRCHRKRGSVSEFIITWEKNVAEKYSDLMEEIYGEYRTCRPRVGDKEIWKTANVRKSILDLVPRWILIWFLKIIYTLFQS
nr:hypothetical protein [Tanacetum cinerariifolium]